MKFFNLLMLGIFCFAFIWLMRVMIRQAKHIKIYGYFWTGSRIMILVAAALCLVPMFLVNFEIGTVVRSLMMGLVIVMFALVSDGAGEDCFIYMGSVVPYDAVNEYDVKETKKRCKVVMNVTEIDKKGRKSQTQLVFEFKKDKMDKVSELLNKKIGKKHRRMKLD